MVNEGQKKFRNYTFTNFDLRDSYQEHFNAKYVAWGLETCPTTGRQHHQGWISFENQRSFQAVRKLMAPMHIEPMRGSIAENDTYCSKEGTLTEEGIKPIKNTDNGREEKQRWARARQLARENRLEEIDDDLFIRYQNSFKMIAKDNMTEPEPCDAECYWIFGPTGTGKSHLVWDNWPKGYRHTMADVKFMEGYQPMNPKHQECVIMEEMSPYKVKWGDFLKGLADKWPYNANVKGSCVFIRPKIIVVTSNYTIRDIWGDPATYLPLERKFKQLHKTRKEQKLEDLLLLENEINGER